MGGSLDRWIGGSVDQWMTKSREKLICRSLYRCIALDLVTGWCVVFEFNSKVYNFDFALYVDLVIADSLLCPWRKKDLTFSLN